jgi:tRNA pseudouridine13 synthase
VYEVDQDGKVLHLKSLGKPGSPKEDNDPEKTLPLSTPGHVVKSAPLDSEITEDLPATNSASAKGETQPKGNLWLEHFDTSLSAFLDGDKRAELKRIYLEGPEAPRVSDNGWAGRVASSKSEDTPSAVVEAPDTQIRKDNRGRGGKRGGRGAGRSGHTDKREDARKVLSEVSHVFRVFMLNLPYMKIAHHI